MSPEERRAEFVEQLTALVEEYAGMSDNVELPVVCDWVMVVAIDDASDADGGGIYSFQRKSQWKHRSIGLCTAASDHWRSITNRDD